MTLIQLEYVVAVDSFRHFKRAADSCFVTQPTLSMQIQKLEDELGLQLFDRSKVPVVATDAGQTFIESAKDILRQVKELKTSVTSQDNILRGEFHLGIIPTLAPYVLPLFLKRFNEGFPEVTLRVSELKTHEIERALKDDNIDAGLLVTPLQNSGFFTDILFYEPFFYFVNSKSKLATKNTVSEKDVLPEEVWLLQEGHCFRDQVLNFCHLKSKTLSHKKMVFESENLETLKNLVIEGSGATFLPYLSAMNLQGNQKELLKPFRGSIPTREVSLIYSRKHAKVKIKDALKEVILRSLPEELPTSKNKKIEVVNIY